MDGSGKGVSSSPRRGHALPGRGVCSVYSFKFAPDFFSCIRFSNFASQIWENAAHFSPRECSGDSTFWLWVWSRGKCCPIFPRKFASFQFSDFEFEAGENAAYFCHEIFHAIRFPHFEFDTGENAAHFSQEMFMLFDSLILSLKQKKSCPLFPRNF